MTAAADLHMHTHYSDGRFSPEEIVRHTAAIGLPVIAITDHENGRGSREAAPLAAQLGVTLIPAVEMSCFWQGYRSSGQGRDIDILGYFINFDDPAFRAYEDSVLADFHDRINECCHLLTQNGYPVTFEEALAENAGRFAGGVQVIRALHHKGYAADWDAARPLYYAQWQHARPSRFTPAAHIQAIHNAGGIAVLAHPTIISHDAASGWIGEEAVAALVEMGLDGIEIMHYRLNDEARAYFSRLAQRFDLITTGGSDEHGWQGFKRLGTEPVTPVMLDALQERKSRKA